MKMGSRGEIRKRRKDEEKDPHCGWLIDLSLTAFSAGALVLFGHWFSRREGRRIGGDRKKYISGDGDRQNKENTSREKNNITPSHGPPMPLVEQRLQRLKAAEERLKPTTRESSAGRLTPLGVIMELKQKVDRLEDEIHFLIQRISGGAMSTVDEKEQLRLLELLALLQLEVDGVKADESVRPHRRIQTNRIQSLIATLDKLKRANVDTE